MIKCIVFDMDDTLYDEIDYYRSGFMVVSRTVSGDFGLESKAVFQSLWEVFNSGNHKNTFDTVLEKFSISFNSEYIQKLVDVLRCHKPDINLPSESRVVLEDLKTRYKLGLITDGWLPAQELKVKALELEKFFNCIVYTEMLGREYWKPSPAGFKKLLAELCVTADQSVYVGDNLEKDFLAPNQMGFKTIRVVRERRIHFGKAPSSQAEAHYEIDSISKLPDLLKEINGV